MATGAPQTDSARLAAARRERFCQEYLKDCCITKAAIRAGYSVRSARPNGHRIFHEPDVQDRIAELMERRAARVQLTQDEVIAGLREEAMAHGSGCTQAARVAAWTQLGKHLGMFRDVVETRDRTLERLMRAAADDRDDG